MSEEIGEPQAKLGEIKLGQWQLGDSLAETPVVPSGGDAGADGRDLKERLRAQIEEAKRRARRRPAVIVPEYEPVFYRDRVYGEMAVSTGWLDAKSYVFATPSLEDEFAELLASGVL